MLMVPFSMAVCRIFLPQEERNSIRLVTEAVVPEQPVVKLDYIAPLVRQLAGSHAFYWKYAGYIPRRPYEYDLYLKLKKEAPESYLLRLTDHENPVIKAYALTALVETNSRNLLSVLEKKARDTSMVMVVSGCIGDYIPINAFYLQQLNGLIDAETYDRYKSIVLKLNPNRNCIIFL